MRAAVPFNTLEYMDELKASGMKEETASAITKATAKALIQLMDAKEIATKSDLQELKIEIFKNSNETMWKMIGIISSLQVFTLGFFTFLQHFYK